jgi:NADH:ubiquinone oxidoreductase subunit 4 (subunit M)
LPELSSSDVPSFSLSGLLREIPRFAIEDISAREYWGHSRRWILCALIVGLAIKTPLAPFHTWWSPACADRAAWLCLILVVVTARIGVYGFARLVWPLMADGIDVGMLLSGLAVFGALHASALALAHDDMRKMAVYLALSQTSLASAGVLSMEPTAAIGGVQWAVGSGFGLSLLLFVMAFLEDRHAAREMAAFGGLVRAYPRAIALMLLACFALAGVPGLAVFPGQFLALGGLFADSWGAAFGGIFASLLLGWALFWMMQRIAWGPLRLPQRWTSEAAGSAGHDVDPTSSERSEHQAVVLFTQDFTGKDPDSNANATRSVDAPRDLTVLEMALLAPLAAGTLLLGLWPQAVVALLRASFHQSVSITL